MNGGTDPAHPFRKGPGIPGIPVFQDDFNAPYHGTGTEGVHDLTVLDFGFDPQVALYSRNWIYDYSLGHYLVFM
jgi:hypothetical protein